MTVNQLVTVIFDTVLSVISLATLVDLARQPNRARLDIALLFGTLALAVVGGALLGLAHLSPPWLGRLTLVLFLAHPWLLVRLVDHFQPLPRLVRGSALAGFLLSCAV